LVKKQALLIAAAMTCTGAMAQMPSPLFDNDEITRPRQWETAAPIIQAGLECRQHIDPETPALRPLFPDDKNWQWELVPPQGFSVFGLPVQNITIFIDPTGEMGASYTASVAAPEAFTHKTLQAHKPRENAIGSLMAQPTHNRPSLTDITCTVIGSYEIDSP